MSTGTGKDRILLGSTELSRVQLDQMDVKTVVVIAETAVDVDQFKGLSVHRIPLKDYETQCSQGDHKMAYTQVSKKVQPILKANKATLCIVASDPDNLPIVLIAEFMMSKDSKVTVDRALEILKANRATSNPLRQFTECLDSKNVIKPVVAKASEAELTQAQRIQK